jgi:hypothetical protein
VNFHSVACMDNVENIFCILITQTVESSSLCSLVTSRAELCLKQGNEILKLQFEICSHGLNKTALYDTWCSKDCDHKHKHKTVFGIRLRALAERN